MRSRFPLFQTVGIAASVAMVFFVVYGWLTRPAVPTPIAAILRAYAPGVTLGDRADASLPAMREVSWVRGLGWIGAPAASGAFDQIQLLPAVGRASGNADAKRMVITSVHLLSHAATSQDALIRIVSVLRRPPMQGCLTPSDADLPHRQVQYWTTPNDRGGAALVSDWSVASPAGGIGQPEVWSLVLWTGPFEGSTTLHASFVRGHCPVP